ncbi:amino acid ABC transporter ATP-binding/permease protein [Conexibacter arvalis]|uniref:ABC-type transport system involved in cytochrome bd biosynthesis fused ATPase/permease subunit n=1 Tax=Conexibacter arvalis TaxID=912552 RepID=A0A840IDK4_9ACTN|nr:ATP-binding cassette domain-containing protein [Conexibacter arvalis]MBB4662331.1 ABC-type transport system involved in cytochrome bd biosynthesis fused ATPase/permease subunit [Conexibacter arvalis]
MSVTRVEAAGGAGERGGGGVSAWRVEAVGGAGERGGGGWRRLPASVRVVALGAGAAVAGAALLAASGWLVTRAAERPPVLALLAAIVVVRALGLVRAFGRYGERIAAHDAAFRQLAELRVRWYRRLVADAGAAASGGEAHAGAVRGGAADAAGSGAAARVGAVRSGAADAAASGAADAAASGAAGTAGSGAAAGAGAVRGGAAGAVRSGAVPGAADLLSRFVVDVDELQHRDVRVRWPVGVAAVAALAATGFATAILPVAGLALGGGLLVAATVVPAAAYLAARGALRRQGAARAALVDELVEAIDAAPQLALAGRAPERLARLDGASAALSRIGRRDALAASAAQALGGLISGATLVAVLAVAVGPASDGRLAPVWLGALALLALGAFEAVTALPEAAVRAVGVSAAQRRLDEAVGHAASADTPPTERGAALRRRDAGTSEGGARAASVDVQSSERGEARHRLDEATGEGGARAASVDVPPSERGAVEHRRGEKTEGGARAVASADVPSSERAAAERPPFVADRTTAGHASGVASGARERIADATQGAPALAAHGLRHRPGGAGAPVVLDGLDLALGAGERVAVIGASGAGKTVLVELLAGLAEPDEGAIERGDGPAHERVRLAGQEAHLFATSIANNVRIGAPGASDREVEAALRATGLGAWLEALPDGIETLVGEEGFAVSGGQRQRITLARCLVSPARVLLLDEPTAMLDPPAAQAFLADLDRAAGGRAVLVVTHERTGLEAFDRVLELRDGRLHDAGRRLTAEHWLSARV